MEFEINTSSRFSKQKPRFLRRVISVNASDEDILKKARQKGFYVKAVNDLDMKSEYGEQPNLKKHKYLKGKRINCLKKVLIKNSGKYEWYNTLKSAKNLERFDLVFVESEIKGDFLSRTINKKCLFKLLKWIKKLPKGIKTITMRIDEIDILEGQLQKIYRTLSLFNRLESFRRVFGFTSSLDSYVQQEMELIKRYLSKPKLNIGYNFRRNISHLAHDQFEYFTAMKAGRELKWMKDLKLQIEPDSLERADFEEEKSIYSNDEDYEDDEVKRLKEEMAIFYRFSLFPNLQKLTLELCNRCLCPLDQFVIEGFRALRNLKKLILTISERPKGTKYLFEGLLEIPSGLSLISLNIPFIRKEEWEMLERFFEKQVDLKTINLEISGFRKMRRGYLDENKCFEEYLGKFLSNKPKLQYLYLRSKVLTIETLSEALKNIQFEGQLRLLSVGFFDENMVTKKTPFERTQGLCDFIVSQKDSLRDLYIEIPFIIDVEVMRYLTRAIMETRVLWALKLFVNVNPKEKVRFVRFFQSILGTKDPLKQDGENEAYFKDIAKMLRELEALNELVIHCFLLKGNEEIFEKDIEEIVKVVCRMEKLRNLKLSIPLKTISNNMLKMIGEGFWGMKRLSSVLVKTGGVRSELDFALQAIVKKVQQKQSLKSDLMF